MPPESVTVKSCRICLQTKYLQCVSFDDGGVWLKMYQFCFGLNLSTKDTPRILCEVCAKKMKEFAKFKSLTHKSDKLWKTIVNIDRSGSLKNETKTPSVGTIKEEYKEVCYIESSDTEPDYQEDEQEDNQNIETVATELVKKEESCDSNYEEEYLNDSNLSETDDQLSDLDVSRSDDGMYEKNNDDTKVLTCENCKKEYKKKKCYKKHIKRNNCKFKDSVPKVVEIEKHDLGCGLCELQSTDPYVIKAHLMKHSANNDLSCKLCDFTGRDFADMETHRFNHQPNYIKSYVCHLCDKRCHVLLALQFHYRTVHLKKEKGGWCTVCNKEYGVYKMWRNHEKWHKAAKYICDICNMKFLFRNSIIEHLGTHSDAKPFICDVCGKGFKRNTNLTLHMRTVHDSKNVTCTHCGKLFKNQKRLEYHLRVETTEKQFQCDICSKRFFTVYKMKSHMAWHSDERPFNCDICGTTYKTKPQLKLHVRKHTGFKPYKCTECPRDFPTSNQLKRHASLHTGVRRYKCPYCEKSFHNKKCLMQHCDKAHYVTDCNISLPKKEIHVNSCED